MSRRTSRDGFTGAAAVARPAPNAPPPAWPMTADQLRQHLAAAKRARKLARQAKGFRHG